MCFRVFPSPLLAARNERVGRNRVFSKSNITTEHVHLATRANFASQIYSGTEAHSLQSL